jgi:hypothetical protein
MSEDQDGASPSPLTSLPEPLALSVKIVFESPVMFLALKEQISTRSA